MQSQRRHAADIGRLFEDEVTSPEAWLQFQHCAFHVAAPARPSRFRRGGVHIAVIWAPNIEGLSGIEVDGTLDGLVEMFNRGQGRAGTSDEDGDSAMDGSGDGEDSRGGTGGAERDGDEDSRDEGAPAAETTVVTRRRRAGTEAGMREITVGMQALWARARKRREL